MINIYKLICPNTFQVKYVGKTKESLNKRLNKHIYNKMNNAPVNKWIKKLILNGQKPIIELIEQVDLSIWSEKEKHWILFYKNQDFKLLNVTEGGDVGSLGYKHTELAKIKISKANSKPKSKEWIKNATNAMIKTVSVPILQFDKNNNLIKKWDSFCFAAKCIKPDNYKSAIKNIHACCNNKRKTAYGFIWKYESIDVKDKEPLR